MGPVLVILGGAAILGVAVAYSPAIAFGLAVVAVMVPLTLRRPYLAGVGLFLWGGVRFWVLQTLGIPALAANAVELLVLAIVVAAALRRGRRDHWLFAARTPWVLLGLFVAEALVSWILNRGAVLDLVSGLRGMLILPALAAATAALVQDVDRDRGLAWRVAKVFALAQMPIAAWQYFFGGGSNVDPDLVVGTLGIGGANVLGVLMLAVLMHSIASFSRTRRLVVLLVGASAVVVMLMCSARLPLLLAPLAGLFVFVTERRAGGLGRRIAVVGAALLIVVPLLFAAAPVYQADLGGGLDPRELAREQMIIEPGRVPRIAYLAYGLAFVNANSAFVPVGVGPGSAASGAAASLGTDKAIEFATGLRLAAAGSVSRLEAPVYIPYPTQVTAVLVEYGVIGLALYSAFIVAMGLAIVRRCLREDFPGADWRVFVMWFGFMTVGAVYANPWEGFSLLGIGFFSTILFLRPAGDEEQ